jgi:hypothetical protein
MPRRLTIAQRVRWHKSGSRCKRALESRLDLQGKTQKRSSSLLCFRSGSLLHVASPRPRWLRGRAFPTS